ncbi:hypothetical protein ACN47E_004460 [Coniothyrium glycines]
MSDSQGTVPSDAVISDKLRAVVIATYHAGKEEELTVKRVRARVEKELALADGFFKSSAAWKAKSERQIKSDVDKYCRDTSEPEPTPKKAAPKPKAKPTEKKRPVSAKSAQGVKRKAAPPTKKPKKKRKTSSDEEDEESEAELSDADSEPPKPARRGRKVVAEDSDEEDEAPKHTTKSGDTDDRDEEDGNPVAPVKAQPVEAADSDSDMSSVIDEAPVKKQRQKKEASAKSKKEARPVKAKAPPKPKAEDDPDQAEVKRLQGWLVKCGIRKVWSKDPELSKCETSKEKIRVLKNMLKDVGMDGKYSVEKAAKIKEKREFAKDLEAIQQGEAAWGQSTEVTSTGRPSRRAAAKPVSIQKVVLSDDSQEEQESGDDKSSDDDDDDDVQVDESGQDDKDKDSDSGDDDSD